MTTDAASPRRSAAWLVLLLAAALALRGAAAVRSEEGRNWDYTNFGNTAARAWFGEWDGLYASGGTIHGETALGAESGDRSMVYTGFPLTAYELWPIGAFWRKDQSGAWDSLQFFKLLCAACYAGGFLLLWPWFRDKAACCLAKPQALALYLATIVLFEPLWFTFRVGGQTTAFAFLGVAAFLRAQLARKEWLAAVALSFALLNKPFLAPGVLVFLVVGEWGLLARCALLGGGAGGLSLALFGVARHREWLSVLKSESARWTAPWSKNAAPISFLHDFFLGPGGIETGTLAAKPALIATADVAWQLVVVAGALWLAWRLRRAAQTVQAEKVAGSDKERGDAIREGVLLLALTLPLLFSTIVWPHYVALAFPVLAAGLLAWPRLDRKSRVLLLLAWIGSLRANWTLVGLLRDSPLASSRAGTVLLAGFATIGLTALALLLVIAARPLLGAAPARSPRP